MAEQQLPIWNSEGVEPPANLQRDGWQPGVKPPAQYFDWLFNRAYKCLEELQSITEALETNKANGEDLITLNNKVTQHLVETNTNAHKISNINGLQTVLDNKIDTSLVNYTGLSLLNGIIGSVQIGVFRNGTRRLYIDFIRTTDIPANTIVANIPAVYRPQRSIPVPLANLNTQTFLGWLILKENGDLTTSQVIPGGVSAVNNFIYGGV